MKDLWIMLVPSNKTWNDVSATSIAFAAFLWIAFIAIFLKIILIFCFILQ